MHNKNFMRFSLVDFLWHSSTNRPVLILVSQLDTANKYLLSQREKRDQAYLTL
jgi:hypothetical protein